MASSSSIVTVPIPHPIIIFNGMALQDWKNCFIQKKNEAVEVAEKLSYNKCLKILMLAELCNCTHFKVRNSKEIYGLAVKFHFVFPNPDCLKVFSENLVSLDVVSQVI